MRPRPSKQSSWAVLDKLTPHQDKVLEKCLEGSIHLMAPAGGGKTFVALHRILRRLEARTAPRLTNTTKGAGKVLALTPHEFGLTACIRC